MPVIGDLPPHGGIPPAGGREYPLKIAWPKLAAAAIISCGLVFIIAMYVVGLSAKSATERDFIEYWAAGQQLVHGANPYDVREVLRIEQGVGMVGDKPKITFSPPVAFFLALPLGFVGAKTGLILWLLTLLGSLSIAIFVLWVLNGKPDSRFHLLGYLFAPAMACLMAGQLGIFLLLGIVLFLYFHRSRPFLAGAVLLPCTLKPHLFLPFAIALLLWVVCRKAYAILAGFSVVLLVSCALTLHFDREAWSQYSEMMRLTHVVQAFVPTLSVALRFAVARNAPWVQFVPEAAACCWALRYFWTRRNCWNWMDQGMLVFLVSALCTPYCWFTDESILLPAVLAGVYRAVDSGRSLLPIAVIAGVALIEAMGQVSLMSSYYLWTVPAWLGWYLYATSGSANRAGEIRVAAADIAD